MKDLKCIRCNGDMIKSYIDGKFSAVRKDGVYDGVTTNRFMCKECGHIEEYAINPKHLENNSKK